MSPVRGRPLLFVVGITLFAALPRVVGAFDAFWLDEIWSLDLAARAHSALQVFTGLHHDNNHYLNTLWLRTLGPDVWWPLYRLPAVVAGVGTVLLAAWTELRAGAREGVLAALLFGVSYPFVHYASEARGYAVVVLLALGAFVLLERLHRSGDGMSALAFGVVAALGFVAHLTFLTVYGPLLAWSAWILVTRRPEGRRAVRLLAAHGIPLAVLALLVLVDVRYMVRGGGPELPPVPGWFEAWGYTLGLPVGGAAGVGLTVAFLAVVPVGLRERVRSGDGSWVFFGLVLTMPLALLLALRTGYAPPRYFLASLAFGLLLLARGLAALLRGGSVSRVAAVAVTTVVVGGNGWRVARFLQDGRGDYQEAVRYLATHTPGDTIRVAGDHDFRNGMVLDYYRRSLPGSTVLEYRADDEGLARPAEWFLIHELDDDFDPAPALTPGGAGREAPVSYDLQAVFPKYGLSGWHWALYRRDAAS